MNMASRYLRGLGRRFADTIDLPLLFALLAVMAISLVVLQSAGDGDVNLVISQAMHFAAGLVALFLIAQVPPAKLRVWTPWLFVATLGLLLLVPVFGSGRTARSWLNLGVFYVQPSELLKLTVPMMVAWYLHRELLPPRWKTLAVSALIIGVPTALIVIQPALGTGVLVAASGAFVVFLAGLAWWRIGLLAALGGSAAPLAWFYVLHQFQKDRILIFLHPESDPRGTGWHIIQSRIAVGSGGLFGKGWGHGTQSHLNFLPEHTTDFVFAVLSEEFGWIGVCVLLALYLFIVGRCLWIAANARETYARLLAGALAMTFFVYAMVNGGMVAGLLPVVGVPMPLLSYGGTSAVSLLAGFGIVMSVFAHRRFMGT
jgi:rod shape determining protein RodA